MITEKIVNPFVSLDEEEELEEDMAKEDDIIEDEDEEDLDDNFDNEE